MSETKRVLIAAFVVMCATALIWASNSHSQTACPDGYMIVSQSSATSCGANAPGMSVGTPNSRSVSVGTAIQATDPTKGADAEITITSTATFSLAGGTTNSAVVVIGPTSAVGTSGGTVIGNYSNSITGTIAVGLNMNSVQTTTYHAELPVGWYVAVRQTSGTVTISSATDQTVW